MNKLYQVDLTAEEREAEHKERRLFIDLLSYMLVLDPTKRHSASQLLQHPWKLHRTVEACQYLDMQCHYC